MTIINLSLGVTLAGFGAACAVVVGVFVWALIVELAQPRRVPRWAVHGGPWYPRTLAAHVASDGDTAPLDPVEGEIWSWTYGPGEWPLYRQMTEDQAHASEHV